MKTGIINTVFRKELLDLFRDGKTLLVGIIIPVVLFPLILLYLNVIVNKNRIEVEKDLKIAVAGDDNSFRRFLVNSKNIRLIRSGDLKADVISGRIYAGVIMPAGFDGQLAENRKAGVRIIIDNRSQLSLLAYSRLSRLAGKFSNGIIRKRLAGSHLPGSILNPVSLEKETVEHESRGAGMLLLSILLPLMLLTYSVISPMAVAADLGAGEKERGTLEHLLCTRGGRWEILMGKFAAVTVFGIIGVVSFLTGVFLSFILTPEFFGETAYTLSFNPFSLILISLLTLFLIMIFGAVLLVVSFYSRSTREAQTLSLPLIILSMASGYGSSMVDIKNYPGIFLHLPLLNASIVIKELVLEAYNPFNIAIVFTWSLLYLALGIAAAGKIFSREKVIFRN